MIESMWQRGDVVWTWESMAWARELVPPGTKTRVAIVLNQNGHWGDDVGNLGLAYDLLIGLVKERVPDYNIYTFPQG